MRVSAFLGTALIALPLVAVASPASASFSGTYSLTFFLGAAHQQGSTQCVTFTHTGGVLDFSNSGTWNSSTFGDWGGSYVVDKKDLRIYGTYGAGTGVTNFHIKFKSGSPQGSGGFDEWDVGDPPSPVGDGIFTLAAGCARTQGNHGRVPSGG